MLGIMGWRRLWVVLGSVQGIGVLVLPCRRSATSRKEDGASIVRASTHRAETDVACPPMMVPSVVRILAAVALTSACGSVFGDAGLAPRVPCDGACIMAKQAVQGVHHPVHQDLGMTPDGRDLVIDDVIFGADRIAIVYHATGIQSAMPRGVQSPTALPAFGLAGPTLIKVTADGNVLPPMDGHERSQGDMSAMNGEMVFRLERAAPHHLDVSIVRIFGDEKATWTTSFDF